jgi:transposase
MSKPLPAPADSFQRIEVITGTGRRRQWPDDIKAAILAETLREGAVITEIARRHRVSASQIFTWRKKACERAAALTAEAASFAPVIMQYPSVQPASFGSLSPPPMIEVEINGARLRIPPNASRDAIFAVIEAVGGLQKRRR